MIARIYSVVVVVLYTVFVYGHDVSRAMQSLVCILLCYTLADREMVYYHMQLLHVLFYHT